MQRVRLKENKKATKKIDAPVIAFGAELTKDKEGELSCHPRSTRGRVGIDGCSAEKAACSREINKKRRKQKHSPVELGHSMTRRSVNHALQSLDMQRNLRYDQLNHLSNVSRLPALPQFPASSRNTLTYAPPCQHKQDSSA